MQGKPRRLIAALVLLTSLVAPVAAKPSQSDEDREWTQERYKSVLNDLLPIERSEIGFRSGHSLDLSVLEYAFVFVEEWKPKHRILVTVKMADGLSIFNQILSLHQQFPAYDIDTIKGRLKVKEWTCDDLRCAAIRVLYNKFYHLRLETMSSEARKDLAKGVITVILDGPIYDFQASIYPDGKLTLTSNDDRHAFVRWALEARRELDRCASWVQLPVKR